MSLDVDLHALAGLTAANRGAQLGLRFGARIPRDDIQTAGQSPGGPTGADDPCADNAERFHFAAVTHVRVSRA